jgi:hypothetical protein
MTEIYRKGFNGLTKDVDTAGRIVTGYFSTFNFKDSDGDIILPGAFKKTIRERGPKGSNRIYHLYQHWTDNILSQPHVLKEDKIGLYFESKMPNTTLANDKLELYREGILKEHSIGFEIMSEESDKEKKVNYIKAVRLWEGSAVTWGANEQARLTGLKGTKPEELLKRIELLEKAMHNGTYTDDTFELLQYEINYIKQSLMPVKPHEPINKSIEPVKPLVTDEELINSFKLGLNG